MDIETAKDLVDKPVKISPKADSGFNVHVAAVLRGINESNGLCTVEIKKNGKIKTQVFEAKYLKPCKSLEHKQHKHENTELDNDLCIVAFLGNDGHQIFTVDKKFSYDLSKTKHYDKANANRAIGKIQNRSKGLPCSPDKIKIEKFEQVSRWITKFLESHPDVNLNGKKVKKTKAIKVEPPVDEKPVDEKPTRDSSFKESRSDISQNEIHDELEELYARRGELKNKIKEKEKELQFLHDEFTNVQNDVDDLHDLLNMVKN